MSREYVLKQILYGIKDQYDAVIIDCMPSLGMITINALAASDEVLIPVEASYLPIKGLQQLLKTIGKVRKQINPKLQVGGILFTMVDAHTNDARNNMELTDEYWINYQKGKGSEEFQKYMEDLTDMQNHVLPYLQSFCNLEEKGVKERREQQIAERYEGRADERVTSTEANEVVKDVGKTDRKPAQQKQAVDGKDKKLSIHERLEINKRIIQEKQGKDKTERGVDLGVRTV
jgi:cellulose biosynthesis protein BcsQ